MAKIYYHVGTFPENIAKECGLKPGLIKINENQLTHIQTDHAKELNGLGIDALDYVRIIAEGFDMIIDQKNGSYKLVKHNPVRSASTFCMIEMTKHEKDGSVWWLITTAQPQSKLLTGNKEIIWTKKR